MDRCEPVELTIMCMVRGADGQVVVQNRARGGWEGCTFPGGHVEPFESVVDAVHREVLEETGLLIENVKLCGIKQWCEPNRRYFVLLFTAYACGGELTSCDEGETFWCKPDEITNHELSSGFDLMLDIFVRDDITEGFYRQVDGEWEYQIR